VTNEEHYSDYKWIKVKRHTDDPHKSWEERYNVLAEHHLKETTFLINEVRSLAKQLDEVSDSEKKLVKFDRNRALFISAFIYFAGGMLIFVLAVDALVEKQIQYKCHQWVTGGMMLFGVMFSSIMTYIKWRTDK